MSTQQKDLIAHYQMIRQAQRTIIDRLCKGLSKEAFNAAAANLGMLQNGILVLDSEDEMAVLMDYAIHDVREQGMNAIERRLTESLPLAGSEDMLILQGMRQARYSIYIVEAIEAGVGVQVCDVLYGGTIFMFDINLSKSTEEGAMMAARIATIDGISMSTGAGLPIAVIPTAMRENVKEKLREQFRAAAAQERSNPSGGLSASIICTCLRNGAMSRMRYAEPGEEIHPNPTPQAMHANWANQPARAGIRVGRNDKCPCNSGKKFKHCCGRRK